MKDETGLVGRFDIGSLVSLQPFVLTVGPIAALEQELGLSWESRREPVDMM